MSKVHMAYEVRVHRGAGWRVEGIFDDETIAVAAAKKAEVRADCSPVVVIQEVYDAARNHLKSRSIYRSGGAPASSAHVVMPFSKATAPRPPATRAPASRRPHASTTNTTTELWPWLAFLIGGFLAIVLLLVFL